MPLPLAGGMSSEFFYHDFVMMAPPQTGVTVNGFQQSHIFIFLSAPDIVVVLCSKQYQVQKLYSARDEPAFLCLGRTGICHTDDTQPGFKL